MNERDAKHPGETPQRLQRPHTTAALILAAGTSSRMGAGRHKLLLPIDDAPVLAHTLEAVLASRARPIVLVLGHRAAEVRAHLAPYLARPDLPDLTNLAIIENPRYAEGMSTSLIAGLDLITKHGYMNGERVIDSALVLLGDQPFMTARIIDALIAAWHTTDRPIVAPLYDGQRGHPTLFAATLFPELARVTGDEGGRAVLKRHAEEIATVALDEADAQANTDLDTWEAYQAAVEEWRARHSGKHR